MEVKLNNSELIRLSKIEPNRGQIEGLPKNPRLIKNDKYEKLKKSLQEHPQMLGLRELLVYPFGDKYVLIGGNMRYRAMKELGFKEAPCKVIPADTSVEELKAYTIKDNSGFGEWDFDELANEWDASDLDDWGVDLPALELEETQEELNAEEDDFDETKDNVEPKCQFGEVWKLGNHRLMCGDSTDEECVKTLMGGVADMVFTDPPYGVSYTEKNEFLNSLGKPMTCPKRIENDDKPPTEMYDFWVKVFKLIFAYTKQKMSYYITAPQGGDLLLLLLLQAVRDSGFMLKHQLIWNKNNHVLGRCDYHYKHEPIIYGWKIGGTHSFYGKGKFKTSVWDIPKPLKNDLHPTMKPIELVSECLLDCSKESDNIIDLFGGSGTTLIACEQLNRKCFMMEYDPHYCDVIIARWEKLTGKKAEKIA